MVKINSYDINKPITINTERFISMYLYQTSKSSHLKTIFMILGFISNFLFMNIVKADVEYLSPEIFEQYGKDAFWEVSIKCSGIDAPRIIQRNADIDGDWCGKQINTFCDSNKTQAAETICSLDYTLRLEELAEAERQENLRQQQAQEQAAREREEQLRLERERAEAERQLQEQLAAVKVLSIEEEKALIEADKNALNQRQNELDQRAAEILELLAR